MSFPKARRFEMPEIDWDITDRNTYWHEAYFTPQAIRDHQAKGSCALYMMIMSYMEEKEWLVKGDIILDPMCGIGTTLILGALRGYDTIGNELEDKYYRDMVGYDEPTDYKDLFGVQIGHIEGSVEKFRRITSWKKNIGRIEVFRGDARKLHETLDDTLKNIKVLSSPPYGNRLRDEAQMKGSNDDSLSIENDWQYSPNKDNIGNCKIDVISSPPYSATTEVGGKSQTKVDQNIKDHNYSGGNIGLSKVKVVSSPPYGRTNEHDEDQMDSLKRNGKHNVTTRPLTYEQQGNIAMLDDSAYSREMLKVYNSLYMVLGHGSYVALITRNFIQEGQVVMLDELTKSLMKRAGFQYLETKRAKLPEMSFFKIINHRNMHKNKGLPLINWEEVTFYMKEINKNGCKEEGENVDQIV